MNLSEQREIAAPPSEVWAALLDPETLKACIPGCKEMTGTAEDGFEATVVQKVGPVKATFKGQVRLEDVVEGAGCKLVGEGKGGAAGFAKGSATIGLAATGDAATTLSYDVEAHVGGKLAQLGSRIIDGFSRRMADQFFTAFQEQIEGPEAPAEAAPDTDEPADGSGEDQTDGTKKGWFKRLLSN